MSSTTQASFEEAYAAALAARHAPTERETLAFSLFNASFFQQTADTRFLLLVMAIEALIDTAPRASAAREHVRALIESTKDASIPQVDKDSMLGTLRWLMKDSINQAGRRMVEERVGMRQYAGRSAPAFFSHVYQLRSGLVHGNLPYPAFQTIATVAAPLEMFVSDLLTIPTLGAPDDA